MLRSGTMAILALVTGCVAPPPAAEPAPEPEPQGSYTLTRVPEDDAPAAEAVLVHAAGARRSAPAGMSEFESVLAATVNRLRREPAWLAARLTRLRRNYEGDYLMLPGVDSPILTSEGTAAVDEAIASARRAKPRAELRLSPGLNRAARAHAVEIGRAGYL
jgi:hypothetical protein